MNDDQIDDLKQFIATIITNTVKESVKDLATKQDLKAGFDGVGDAIETLSNHIDKHLDDHEARITVLEQAA